MVKSIENSKSNSRIVWEQTIRGINDKGTFKSIKRGYIKDSYD